jgi:hypothetical protein
LPVRVDFIPVKDRLSKVVKLIRQSRRAFPLEEIAQRFMDDPHFIQVKFNVNDHGEGQSLKLYQCKTSGMLFTDAGACEKHAVAACLDVHFTREERPIDPPSGNFLSVARCRKTGEILGPPNHHSYAAASERLRSTQFSHLTPESFKRQIENVQDAALVEAWKQQLSVQAFFTEVELKAKTRSAKRKSEKKAPAAEDPAVAEDPALPADPAVPAESTPPGDAIPAVSSEAETPAEAEVAPPVAPEAEAAAPESTEAAPEAEADQPTVADEEPAPALGMSQKEAESIIQAKYLGSAVQEVRKAICSGVVALHTMDPQLLQLVTDVFEREKAHPKSIILALRPAFKHMHLYLFRAGGKNFVTGIHPQALEDQNVATEIREVLTYLSEHPGSDRKHLFEALRPGMDPKGEEARSMLTSLRWLVDNGHAIEFFDGAIAVPR